MPPIRMCRRLIASTALLAAIVLVQSGEAQALPRFAARNGMECAQCHVNPTGGGIRNRYGRDVFAQAWLSRAPSRDEAAWTAEALQASELAAKDNGSSPAFSGELLEWLSIGADVRLAYLWVRPDHAIGGGAPDITSTFFLMQADLYHAARIGDHLSLVLDIGVYSGFEAWSLIDVFPDARDYGLYFKLGRFLPPFGVREVEHQLFTRAGVGLGAGDRDTGLEIGGFVGPLSYHVALLNGTLGDAGFDTSGTEKRDFEKGVAARVALRGDFGPLRTQVGGSFYFNENMNQPNPLFSGVLPPALSGEPSQGVNEIRAGGFLTASLGRFTYIGDLVYVRDAFFSAAVAPLEGYASYQELSFVALQGLEFVLTAEFMEPNINVADDATTRLGFVIETFPLPSLELRAMVRRSWSDASPTGGAWDVVLFAHTFL